METMKSDISRASKKKMLVKAIIIIIVIIGFILIFMGVRLRTNNFPYSGYTYWDDSWTTIEFSKNGVYSLAATDAGDDLSDCGNERYLYNKKDNTLNLYCWFRKVGQLKIIKINENDIVYDHIRFNEPNDYNYKHVYHMKHVSEDYMDYSENYKKMIEVAGKKALEGLAGKALYFEEEYSKDNIAKSIVYFKDKDTVLYNLDNNVYKAETYFRNYSGKIIDIEISVCGSLEIIYDLENNKIIYTNGKEKDPKNINIDVANVKDADYNVCSRYAN